jgi:hypothetical protein
MAKRKNYSKGLMVPGAEDTMTDLRLAITKQLGYFDVSNPDSWWDMLAPAQKSEVNGIVTKMMVEKAKRDMIAGKFQHPF